MTYGWRDMSEGRGWIGLDWPIQPPDLTRPDPPDKNRDAERLAAVDGLLADYQQVSYYLS